MDSYKKLLEKNSEQFHKIRKDPDLADKRRIPGDAYFLENDDVLSLSRDDGDSRYPYGKEGFNFWAYSSGYMHSNEGLFSHFLRSSEGQEPRIAFFAGIYDEQDRYRLVSLLSVPVLGMENNNDILRYTIFSKTCVYYMTEVEGLRFAVRVFPDKQKKLHFTLSVENLGKEPKRLFISTYFNPFLAHNLTENAESKWFREVRYIEDGQNGNLGSFIFKVNEDLSRTVSVANFGILKRNVEIGTESEVLGQEATTSRYQYVGGSRGSLHHPYSPIKGTFGKAKHVCAFTEMGIAGDIVRFQIGGTDMVRFDLEFSFAIHCEDNVPLNNMLARSISAKEVDILAEDLEKDEKSVNGQLFCKVANSNEDIIKEDVLNSFFKHLKKQVEFCSLIKGYVQLSAGSLIGIRDIFQAIEGLLYWQPHAARSKMLEALDFVFVDGRCPRQYSLPYNGGDSPVMDLRPFIDQGVWVISTIAAYLKATGDMAFLEQVCGYYEIVDEKRGLVKKSDEKGTVLEHMYRTMDYLLSNRDFDETGCIKALYGDWNDALDGLGVSMEPGREYGSGVSVMASLQVYQNLNEMIDILIQFSTAREIAYATHYMEVLSELREGIYKYAIIMDDNYEGRILHGWGDRRSYLVGSFCDTDGSSRHGLTSNAFWILSGIYDADTSLRETIMNAFEALDSKYGFKTFEPYFAPNTPGVGRIPKLPAGTAENGAVYIHASAFAVMALFRMGCSKKAWEQLYKLLPFTHERISCSSFVMPNSYGFNENLLIDGESMHDWQTGSSNVILKTMIRYVFGIEPEYGGVFVQPAGWCPFKEFKFNISIKSCNIIINYKNKGKGYREYKINGLEREGIYNEIMGIERLWIPDSELMNSIKVDVED